MPIPILVLQVQITTIPVRTLLSGFLLPARVGQPAGASNLHIMAHSW
jgi:hypothetical protein